MRGETEQELMVLVPYSGVPLFKDLPEKMNLQLLEVRPFRSGVVVLRYEPIK